MISNIIVPVLSLIAIFLFGVKKFTKQIHQANDEKVKNLLQIATKTRTRGLLLGAGFTSLIQSSTATTVILASLVGAGLVSFKGSLAAIFGANIGTTVTSQLVALHIPNVAPYIILIGFIMSLFSSNHTVLGKSIFYFGLMFFSLSLVSLYLEPIKTSPEILTLFSNVSNIYIAILVGFVFTSIIQSSSITSGLVLILVVSSLLNFNQALGIIIGANLGTTVTALVASMTMNAEARKVGVAHFLFNLIGILLFLPFIDTFSNFVQNLGGSTEQQVANAHVIFNLICAALFMILLNPFYRVVNFIVR